MYRYVEISNAFQIDQNYVVFAAGNTLVFSFIQDNQISITLNNINIQFDMMCFNEAISMIPAFKYGENQRGQSDVAIITTPHFYYHVDNAGQFNENYYGMRFELIDHILVEKSYVDLNDQYQFERYKLGKLVKETKTVLYYPHFLV